VPELAAYADNSLTTGLTEQTQFDRCMLSGDDSSVVAFRRLPTSMKRTAATVNSK
jgi:hypothetical protein